jgi:hypothetical protein
MVEATKIVDAGTRNRLIERYRVIDGSTLHKLIGASLEWLRTNQQIVNSLNVFPVPDGDTGNGGARQLGCDSLPALEGLCTMFG